MKLKKLKLESSGQFDSTTGVKKRRWSWKVLNELEKNKKNFQLNFPTNPNWAHRPKWGIFRWRMLKTSWKCIANKFEHFNFGIGSFHFLLQDPNLNFLNEKSIISKFKFSMGIFQSSKRLNKLRTIIWDF